MEITSILQNMENIKLLLKNSWPICSRSFLVCLVNLSTLWIVLILTLSLSTGYL